MTPQPFFEIRHVVGFEETNLVGNVYYVNHFSWQGRCREMFLREHCPGLLEELNDDLVLVTTRCACDYFGQLSAFDEVAIRMRLAEMAQNRITMRFEYFRQGERAEELVARGEQQIACMRRQDGGIVPTPVPAELKAALEPFSAE
ncbi:MAG: acyl-CoA thioesterase [bacterium]|nr:acyl-CoA thioesterase [bacterium]